MTQGRIRSELAEAGTWVIKVGSALITDEGKGLDTRAIGEWVDQMAALAQAGKRILLVSSGAIAEGMSRLKWTVRPNALYELQAAAAVGQMGLVQAYESHFQRHGIHTAQVLLTHEDLADRTRYLNARTTIRKLLELGVVPVINENDTVAAGEIRFGDNDTLAALVANLVEADLQLIMTDQQGLYERDPRIDPNARFIAEARAGDVALEPLATPSRGRHGSGGMITKLQAATKAARSGTHTIIAWGRARDVLLRIAEGEALGTLLYASTGRLAARKQWLAGQLQLRGKVHVDEGAARALRERGKSLLPVGVTRVEGSFGRGELVPAWSPAEGSWRGASPTTRPTSPAASGVLLRPISKPPSATSTSRR